MDRPYVPTPAQVAGMRAEVEKRLAQYDQIWVFVSTFDATTLCNEGDACKCVGANHVLDQIRDILEGRTGQAADG
jgi:hypothetical protein